MAPCLGPTQVTNWYAANYTGVYYLESSIHIINGGKLSIDGSEKAADGSRVSDECETLLLVRISGHRGHILKKRKPNMRHYSPLKKQTA